MHGARLRRLGVDDGSDFVIDLCLNEIGLRCARLGFGKSEIIDPFLINSVVIITYAVALVLSLFSRSANHPLPEP